MVILPGYAIGPSGVETVGLASSLIREALPFAPPSESARLITLSYPLFPKNWYKSSDTLNGIIVDWPLPGISIGDAISPEIVSLSSINNRQSSRCKMADDCLTLVFPSLGLTAATLSVKLAGNLFVAKERVSESASDMEKSAIEDLPEVEIPDK